MTDASRIDASTAQPEPYAAAVDAVWSRFPGRMAGCRLAEVMCVKGRKGPAEQDGQPVCSGADGDALAKAFLSLGYDDGAFCFMLSDGLSAGDVLELVEATDPMAVVSLDVEAATLVRSAFGYRIAPYGVAVQHAGRAFLAVDSFENSLSSQEGKRASWEQLKAIRRRKASM